MRDLSYYYGSMNYNEFFVPTPPHPATQDLLNGSQLSFMVGLMEEVYRAATCSEDHEEEIPEEQEGAGSQTWSNLVAFPGRDEKEDFDDVQPHLARLDHSSVLGGGGGGGGKFHGAAPLQGMHCPGLEFFHPSTIEGRTRSRTPWERSRRGHL